MVNDDILKKARWPNIELLRVISMIMIMFLHFFNQGKVLESVQGGVNYYYVWITEGVCFVSVNCFMLISGFFLWRKKFKYKRVIALYFEIIFYTLILTAVSLLLGWESLTPDKIAMLPPVVSRNNWYVTVYFALYLISPILNLSINKLDKRSLKTLLIIAFLLFSVIPTVFFYTDQFNVVSGYSILWYAFMYVTGGYIGKHGIDFSNVKSIAMLSSILILPVSKIILSNASVGTEGLSRYDQIFYKYNSIPVFLASLALFVFFLKININNDRINQIAIGLGGTTFGIFYIHSFFMLRDHLWVSLGSLKYLESSTFITYSIAVVLLVFIVCSALDKIRQIFFKMIHVDKAVLAVESALNKKIHVDG